MAPKQWSINHDTSLAHIILWRTFAVRLVISKRTSVSLAFTRILT